MGNWHERPAFDVQLGNAVYTKHDESEANVVVRIRPHSDEKPCLGYITVNGGSIVVCTSRKMVSPSILT
jgi:hypothetical protein